MQHSAEMLFREALSRGSDIRLHLSTLYRLASMCECVTEFGVRDGNSSMALLAGLPVGGRLVSYDIRPCGVSSILDGAAANAGKEYRFVVGSSLEIDPIDPCDLLFIDTVHDGSVVIRELRKHGASARKFLAFHDTWTFGWEGDQGIDGMIPAILDYMSEDRRWGVWGQYRGDNGLLVLESR